MAGWFGLTIHQQSDLEEPSTAHGMMVSQVTMEMRIVLFWTFTRESGMTPNAFAAPMVPMSFVKKYLKNGLSTKMG